MSEQKTLSLDSGEWKALLLSNLERAYNAVKSTESPAGDGVVLFNQHLDRMKGIAAAWAASAPKPMQPMHHVADEPYANQLPKQVSQVHSPANGVAKKKRGWPKGMKRKKPEQVEAIQ